VNPRADQTAEYAATARVLLADDRAQPESPALDALGHSLLGEFNQAEVARRDTEQRWLKDLRQYRGKYDPEVEAAIGPNRSKAFVRKTRVKIKTVNSRVADLLFPAGADKNWDIAPTPKPSLSGDQMQEIRALLAKAAQQGAKITRQTFDQAVLEWAKARSKAMGRVIDDQLVEARYKQTCLKAIHSGNLYGTGIVKGPLVERKVRTRFIKQGGKWVPQTESYVVPFVDFVPLWRWYPDMSATELSQCRFVYELHMMSKSDMADLADRRSFRRQRIVDYVKAHPHGEAKLRTTDTELSLIGDRQSSMTDVGGKYEVLERWGYLDGQQLRDAGVDVPEERAHESFFSNVWLLPNGQIIKAVLQPINGVTWPYHIYYFDKDESSIFAEGLASIMRDDQTMLNASTRLMLDNAAITSGPQLEVTPGLLTSMEKVDEFNPWKVWLRNNASPGQRAVHAIELPSRLPELSAMAQMFENNADEVSAIPRYMSGENATSGAAGTAAGMSMLIGNVNIVIKDLISNWDEGVTISFIKGLYHWNMQFSSDDAIKGDFDVKARGTASLVAKEVRARALNEFAAMTANELDAPFIKRDVLNRQRAEANELTDCVKTEEEVKAEMGSQQAQMQQQMAMQAQQLQLAEAQAKVSKLMADAEASQAKARETLANIELIVAKAVSTKVEAAYAALQAGGVATSTPHIAPAGDEILRSSGWQDATPDPSIAQLAGPPVQPGEMPVQPEPPQPEGIDAAAGLDAPTGMVGRRAGIETVAVD